MIETAFYTDAGGRVQNDDSVRGRRIGDKLCLVVADGLGGHGRGDVASSLAAETICGAWDGRVDTGTLGELLRQAHENVRRQQIPGCAMKSTAVVLLVEEGRAVWAHVGDSRLYHFREGKRIFQTRDHSVSQIAVLLGEITADEIRFHPSRARILRALGQDDELKVETGEARLEPGFHAFLLCSDGFWEYVLESEMEQDLARSPGPEEWIARMADRVRRKAPGDNDNNTAAAAWITV